MIDLPYRYKPEVMPQEAWAVESTYKKFVDGVYRGNKAWKDLERKVEVIGGKRTQQTKVVVDVESSKCVAQVVEAIIKS